MYNRVREVRRALRLSQAELARRAGVTRVTVWRIEKTTDPPMPGTRRRLAKALGIKEDDLFRWELVAAS
jgi:transcriptional regulator with XRE-family HTH domain